MKLFTAILLLTLFFFPFTSPAHAGTSTEITNPAVNARIGGNSTVGNTAVPALLRGLVGLGIGLSGTWFMIMLLRGGFEYINAGSDKEHVQKAVNHIKNALTGMAIVLSIYVISWTLGTIFGISLISFNIPVLTP